VVGALVSAVDVLKIQLIVVADVREHFQGIPVAGDELPYQGDITLDTILLHFVYDRPAPGIIKQQHDDLSRTKSGQRRSQTQVLSVDNCHSRLSREPAMMIEKFNHGLV
jgi:hypothetical protein